MSPEIFGQKFQPASIAALTIGLVIVLLIIAIVIFMWGDREKKSSYYIMGTGALAGILLFGGWGYASAVKAYHEAKAQKMQERDLLSTTL